MTRLAAGTPLSSEARTALETATVDGALVVLHSGQLARPDYEQVDAVLTRIAGGGKWNRHKGGHVFSQDPRVELAAAIGAGILPPDPKRRDGWFATPRGAAEELVLNHALAGLQSEVGYEGLRVLEPSAGEGALADAVVKWGYGKIHPAQVQCVETDPWRAGVLEAKGYPTFRGRFQDWAARPDIGVYDLVVMNPPFVEGSDKQAWIFHVMMAWRLVAPGGRLVSIVPAGLEFRTDRRTVELRKLVTAHGTMRRLPEGSFEESGTGIGTMVVALDRPLVEPDPVEPTALTLNL
jgi:hypothetical protein